MMLPHRAAPRDSPAVSDARSTGEDSGVLRPPCFSRTLGSGDHCGRPTVRRQRHSGRERKKEGKDVATANSVRAQLMRYMRHDRSSAGVLVPLARTRTRAQWLVGSDDEEQRQL
ncbi:hypothetical protein ZWY2020_032202 [Hordeum vulgare]|nr:hypothetical protein ZWY2020_032190 [Hordeum vulgare]KAI5004959.1 hypothetical protein ZWY2020_032202 [Hordeum vulgare]